MQVTRIRTFAAVTPSPLAIARKNRNSTAARRKWVDTLTAFAIVTGLTALHAIASTLTQIQ